MRYAIAAAVLIGAAAVSAQGTSKWVYPDAKARLQYAADARGNRIMDFSHPPGVAATPASLYLAQVRDRLGEQPLLNIGR